MTLIQLTVFCELMQSGSIAKTAHALGRTQPAISLAIKNLESAIGFPLFEKQGRQLVAVPEAYYFLDEAKEILSKTSNLKLSMENLRMTEAGSLTVATMPGPGTFLFPKFLSNTTSKTKDIKISLAARSSSQIYEMASSQSIDFGFADAVQTRSRQNYALDIIEARCFCAMHADHPLANKKFISIKALHNQELGGLHENTLSSATIKKSFEEKGYQYNKVINSQTFLALLQFVRSKQCLAIVDPLTVATELEIETTKGEVVFRPIKESVDYQYAIISPAYRPMSRFAEKIKTLWTQHVMKLLIHISAEPTMEQES